MAFSTDYTSFGASISSWLDIGASDLGASMVADLITVGETRLFREARTRDMETAISTSVASGLVAVPSGYVAMKYLYVNTNPQVVLERRSADWLRGNFPQNATSGIPQYFARDTTNFIFGPYPDSAYTVAGVYYKRLTSISGSALNAMFVTNPDLYLFACLAESEIVIGRDERIPIWESKYSRILADVNGMDKAEDSSGSALQMRTTDRNFTRFR